MTRNDESSDAGEVPALCVDLDGSLIKTDLLFEAVLQLLGRTPLALLLFPLWLSKGLANFKHQIALRTQLDATTIPYDHRVLELVATEKLSGRCVVLVTASNESQVRPIAEHLASFDDVFASTRSLNLKGRRKAERLVATFGERGFDYIGNHRSDLKVWARARRAWVVNASRQLAAQAGRITDVGGVLPATGSGTKTWLKAARLHQWLKNLLVFVPLIAAHQLGDYYMGLQTALAFLAFGLCASSVYVVNDLLDLQADRQHPRKRKRPFAAGDLSIPQGAAFACVSFILAFILAARISAEFATALAIYWTITTAYSLRLKQIEVLDVTTLAALYTLRVIGGALAIDVEISFWLLGFSMFLFFSLAVLKRLVELRAFLTSGRESLPGRGYTVADLPLLQALGTASGLLAVLVLALYINSPESIAQYRHPGFLWLFCPLLMFWISRIWLLANRGDVHDDPLVYAATDKTSLATAAIGVAIFAIAL